MAHFSIFTGDVVLHAWPPHIPTWFISCHSNKVFPGYQLKTPDSFERTWHSPSRWLVSLSSLCTAAFTVIRVYSELKVCWRQRERFQKRDVKSDAALWHLVILLYCSYCCGFIGGTHSVVVRNKDGSVCLKKQKFSICQLLLMSTNVTVHLNACLFILWFCCQLQVSLKLFCNILQTVIIC